MVFRMGLVMDPISKIGDLAMVLKIPNLQECYRYAFGETKRGEYAIVNLMVRIFASNKLNYNALNNGLIFFMQVVDIILCKINK